MEKLMPSLLIIRLHPVDPITGDAFTSYLTGLSVAAHDVSFVDPAGGGAAFGTATYIAPSLPPSPDTAPPIPNQDPDNTITQHFEINHDPIMGIFSREFF